MKSLLYFIPIIITVALLYHFQKKKQQQTLEMLRKRKKKREAEEQKEKEFEASREKLPYNDEYNIDSISNAEVVCDTKVAGVSHDTKSGKPRQEIVPFVDSREILDLIPEPENPHDSNAIMVVNSDGYDLGYLPSEISAKLNTDKYDYFSIANRVLGYHMPTSGLSVKILSLEKENV